MAHGSFCKQDTEELLVLPIKPVIIFVVTEKVHIFLFVKVHRSRLLICDLRLDSCKDAGIFY